MMIPLNVSREAQQLGITHPIACSITNVRVIPSEGILDSHIATLMEELSTHSESILAREEVQAFRGLFARLGYPEQIPAGQRLIESFQQRGFRSYNNVVDAYNIASALFGSGLGMHDPHRLANYNSVDVFRAMGVESITPLFKDRAVNVSSGDLVYSLVTCQSLAVLAWLGKKDVDSDQFKVTERTDELLLIALGNHRTSEQYNRDACLKAYELISYTCPDAIVDFLDVQLPTP